MANFCYRYKLIQQKAFGPMLSQVKPNQSYPDPAYFLCFGLEKHTVLLQMRDLCGGVIPTWSRRKGMCCMDVTISQPPVSFLLRAPNGLVNLTTKSFVSCFVQQPPVPH